MLSSFESTKNFLKNLKKRVDSIKIKCYYNTCPAKKKINLCGYYSKEDTPVPIPNTEVKLFSGNGTWWATAWESST